ncbi:Protein phosphatase 1 regulatory subunit 3B [Coemansia spiralis]|nr:Protein phosphatase 1 regulatory subunit 3B [Coemansia spiralis]
MTADEWRTYTDIPATYSSSSSIATTGFDHFSFALPVVDAVPEVCVALCVCYRVGGCEYWDNNGGANYLFRLSRPAMPPPAAAAPPAATHTLSPPPTTAPSSATKRYMRYSEAQFSAAIYDGAPLPPPSHWSSSYLFGSAQLSDLYRAHSPLAASHAWPSLSATPLHC